ncbi:toll/interleukin-1 receptor domain-containing protein [Mesorhizobium sp. M0139]|uniref:toll/interleukin-1 receptor domain-containing protein n=1 Tax=Mesorhizobium sp. M0139 TaxID=2956892 RepID=UPI00333CBEF7
MLGDVFINYRRQTDSGVAGRVYDNLNRALPDASIFMDVDKLNPGDDFEVALARSLASCKIMLAIVGPQWAALTDEQGQVRLESPDDFVRKEIRTALQAGVRVIPVLVNGASMPKKSALPPDLQDLAKRQAMEVRHERFNDDMAAIASAIAKPAARRPRLWLLYGLVAMIALGIGGTTVALWPRPSPLPSPIEPAAIEAKGCKEGFVWRSAIFGDSVCVSPADYGEVQAQNANARNNRSPTGGPYGDSTCRDGYVWREAFESDLVCVTPFERDKARKQNADNAYNRI